MTRPVLLTSHQEAQVSVDGLKLVQATLEGLKDNTPELKGEFLEACLLRARFL